MALKAVLSHFGLLFLPLGAALAQSAPSPHLSPAAEDQALSFRSTFEGYQRFSDEKVGSWRAANDNVGRIGGWREYAKEARPSAGGAAPAAGAAPSGITAPTGRPGAPVEPKDPHAGHGAK